MTPVLRPDSAPRPADGISMKTPVPRAGILAALAIPTSVHGRVLGRAPATHLAGLRTRFGEWGLPPAG
jgi:hypothetical protein